MLFQIGSFFLHSRFGGKERELRYRLNTSLKRRVLSRAARSAVSKFIAIMANPRKFSEKIALHTHRQAEETARFEQIMKEVSDATARVCKNVFKPPQTVLAHDK